MKFASIDIGSNTVLLLIASVTEEGGIQPLVEKAEITRLGEKLDQNGSLSAEAMDRTLKTLLKFTDLCHRNQVERIACVGTEALRRAQNSHEFVQQVAETCGFRVEIITGKKEAELSYLSALLDFSETYSNLVVLDIGGGSTEITWQKEVQGDIARLQMVSMKMGSVRLTETFLKTDPIDSQEYQELQKTIDERLSHDLNPLLPPEGDVTLIGLAGTVTTLSALDQKLDPYDSQKIQGAILTRSSLIGLMEEMKAKTLEERKKMVGMEPKRADVLPAGAAILDSVMRKFKADRVIVSDHGIRYGLFYQKFVAGNAEEA